MQFNPMNTHSTCPVSGRFACYTRRKRRPHEPIFADNYLYFFNELNPNDKADVKLSAYQKFPFSKRNLQ
jgi:hypothetical protein